MSEEQRRNVPVHLTTRRLLVGLKRVCSEQEQGGASVNDAGARENSLAIILDLLVDAPIFACWRDRSEWYIGYIARNSEVIDKKIDRSKQDESVLGLVNTSKGELAVHDARCVRCIGRGSGWLIGDADGVGGNCFLGEEVVGDGGDELFSGESALSEIDGADAVCSE